MAKGWLIAVMVEVKDEPVALRHYFAVGYEDRAKAEWTAIDQALLVGQVAVSPVGGLEPVQAVGELSAKTIAVQALSDPRTQAALADIDRLRLQARGAATVLAPQSLP